MDVTPRGVTRQLTEGVSFELQNAAVRKVAQNYSESSGLQNFAANRGPSGKTMPLAAAVLPPSCLDLLLLSVIVVG